MMNLALKVGMCFQETVHDNGEFVGIYPQGIQRSWNLGSEASRADDVQFINLIIEELKIEYRSGDVQI